MIICHSLIHSHVHSHVHMSFTHSFTCSHVIHSFIHMFMSFTHPFTCSYVIHSFIHVFICQLLIHSHVHMLFTHSFTCSYMSFIHPFTCSYMTFTHSFTCSYVIHSFIHMFIWTLNALDCRVITLCIAGCVLLVAVKFQSQDELNEAWIFICQTVFTVLQKVSLRIILSEVIPVLRHQVNAHNCWPFQQ